MANSEEQNTKSCSNPYLESPKAFHLEMPLYHRFYLTDEDLATKIHERLRHNGTIDAYCIFCKKESIFRTKIPNAYIDSSGITDYNHRNWLKEKKATSCVSYSCAHDHGSGADYYVYYLKIDKLFTKIGQWPSIADLQLPEAQKYRKILKDEQFKEFTKGIGLAAHSVGIGSFVYLRRIFENLVEEAREKTQGENENFSNDKYQQAKMDEKIKIVKNYLPEFLVENRSLYAILSKGIHELTEDECLQYFETVKIGIEQILDEKITQKEKEEKAAKAREAIQKAHGKLSDL